MTGVQTCALPISAEGPSGASQLVASVGAALGGVLPTDGYLGSGTMPAVFGQASMEYAYENDGVGFEQFAKVAEKNHMHSTLNPLAHYQKPFTLEEVMDAEMMSYPNTLLMCCPTGDGAAALVLVSEEKLKIGRASCRERVSFLV